VTEREFPVPADWAREEVAEQIEQILATSGLVITLRGTLAMYPGCTHWHLKKHREKGTLELTWWPARSRLWFKIASGRQADWMSEAMDQLLNY
jgi:hypothetical protein